MGDFLDHNLWYFVIINLVEFLKRIIPSFPDHQYWGIPIAVAGYGAELFAILFVFLGSFIRLDTLMRLALLGLLVATWKYKGKLLNVIALVRFFL